MFSNVFASLHRSIDEQPHLAAIVYILISTTAFSAMNVAVRLLAADFHPTLIVALRTLVTLAMLMPWVLHHGAELLYTPRWRTHMLRGFVGGVGMVGWTYSVSILPVTHATALSFTAPLFVTLLAILFLGEHGSWQRWMALSVGFLGTLVILRPSAAEFDTRSFVVLGTSVVWAITGILVKQLSATEPPLRMVFYMNLFMLLLTAPFAAFHLQMPDMRHGLSSSSSASAR